MVSPELVCRTVPEPPPIMPWPISKRSGSPMNVEPAVGYGAPLPKIPIFVYSTYHINCFVRSCWHAVVLKHRCLYQNQPSRSKYFIQACWVFVNLSWPMAKIIRPLLLDSAPVSPNYEKPPLLRHRWSLPCASYSLGRFPPPVEKAQLNDAFENS